MEKQYSINEEVKGDDNQIWVVTNVLQQYPDDISEYKRSIQQIVCRLKTKKGLGKTMCSFSNDRTTFKISR